MITRSPNNYTGTSAKNSQNTDGKDKLMVQVVREKILSQSCGTSQRDHEIKAIIDQQHHHQEQNRKKLPTHSHNYPN